MYFKRFHSADMILNPITGEEMLTLIFTIWYIIFFTLSGCLHAITSSLWFLQTTWLIPLAYLNNLVASSVTITPLWYGVQSIMACSIAISAHHGMMKCSYQPIVSCNVAIISYLLFMSFNVAIISYQPSIACSVAILPSWHAVWLWAHHFMWFS